MIEINVQNNQIYFGERFRLAFMRTLRIPDDGKTYPLPPGLEPFPVFRVKDYSPRLPGSWIQQGGVFIPMFQREAMWLAFFAEPWKPNAVQVAVGGINAISGAGWDGRLHADPQDYLVCPDQPWLDGINAGPGMVRQFVAMPLGMGYSIEAQVSSREEQGGIQVKVFEPRPGIFPDEPPEIEDTFGGEGTLPVSPAAAPGGVEMGIAAGGRMEQKIYPDPHGLGTWDEENSATLHVHILNSLQFSRVTGCPPPESPVTAQVYTHFGFPWFSLYDDEMGDLSAPETLTRVQSIAELDQQHGELESSDIPLEIDPLQIHGIHYKKSQKDQGKQP